MASNTGPKRRVGVFWDVENCQIPSDMPGHEAALRIKCTVRHFGELVELNAYGDIHFCNLIKRVAGLRKAGVHFIETPHQTKKQVADMRIIADIVAFAFSQASLATVVLISNDGDFAHAVSLIQEKGHCVWLISNEIGTSEKLIALADGRMSWKWDVLAPPHPLAESLHAAPSMDKDVRSVDEEKLVAPICHSAFPDRFGQIPSIVHLPIPIRFCQTSSSSFSASSSMRPLVIQTSSLSASQGDSNLSNIPASIITSSSVACSASENTPPTANISAPEPTPRRAPPSAAFTFRPLIKVLRDCGARGTCKIRMSKVVQKLAKREPTLIAEHKGPKRYLAMARSAGVILMDRPETNQPILISLHPDYC